MSSPPDSFGECIMFMFPVCPVGTFVCLLSTHADRLSLHKSVTVCVFVCVFVCMVTDFSGEDKASGVKFCTVVHGRPGQVFSHLGELCFPRSPKSDESATLPEVKFRVGRAPVIACLSILRGVWT